MHSNNIISKDRLPSELIDVENIRVGYGCASGSCVMVLINRFVLPIVVISKVLLGHIGFVILQNRSPQGLLWRGLSLMMPLGIGG